MNLQDMRTSVNGRNLVKKFEAWSAIPYHGKADKPGVMTIGWGHVILSFEKFTVLSEQEGENLLTQDLLFAEHDVKRFVKVELNQNQFDALVSAFFNIGDQLGTSTLIRLVNQCQYTQAGDHFVEWDHGHDEHGNLVEVPGLKTRRLLEKNLWLAPVQ